MSRSSSSAFSKSRSKSGNDGGAFDDAGLKQWLINQNFYMDKGCDPRNTTHLLMTGGKLCIADDQYDTFLRYYADDLSRKSATRWWSIHENATRYSRVYFDFDIAEWVEREGAEMKKEQIEQFMRIVQTQVLAHFPAVSTRLFGINNKLDHRGVCIVLGAPPSYSQKYRETTKMVEWRRKTGLHVVFPYLYADLNQLLQLRTASIDALDRQRHQFLPPDGAASWDSVIDIGVYTGNAGLRMPGSDKFDTCEACRRKRSAMCNVCNGRERVRIERAYWPLVSLDATGKTSKQWEYLCSDPLRMLQLCTIRRPYQYVNDPPFLVPPKAAVYADTPIVYMVDTQYILDNLPLALSVPQQTSSTVNNTTSTGGGAVGNLISSRSRTNSSSDLPDVLPIENNRVRNPGTSWSLAARESRGYKRTSSSAAGINEMTGGKRGQGMSANARRDFAATRELQQFDGNHYFAELFQTFLRTLPPECGWTEYERICVTQVKRSIPTSLSGQRRGKKKAEAETLDALQREQQITADMMSIDDPRPCVYLINVQGQGARYCHNVGREHSSSKIYFYANADGIVQRCFCKKQYTATAAAKKTTTAAPSKSAVVAVSSVAKRRSHLDDNDAIPVDDDDDNDTVVPFVDGSRPFCSAYSSKPIKWTDHARGMQILDTFFGYRKHGSIDQPTYDGSLRTILLPAGSSLSSSSSRNMLFSTAKLIQTVANEAIANNNDDNDNDEEEEDEHKHARKAKQEIDEMNALLSMAPASGAIVNKNPALVVAGASSAFSTSTTTNQQQQLIRIEDEKAGSIPPDLLRSIISNKNIVGGCYMPPRHQPVTSASLGRTAALGGRELCVPSLPVATSLAQAEQQAVMLMRRNLRGQRQRIEKFTGGLPKRDEIAPELRARLAPPQSSSSSSSGAASSIARAGAAAERQTDGQTAPPSSPFSQ